MIAYSIIILHFTAGISNVIKASEISSTDDDTDVDTVPITEEVMNSNITINDAVSRQEADEETDPLWNINLAVRDVAYYLRAHKFLDYDHRYYKPDEDSRVKLYQDFPKPPLRSLHWEVHRFCANSFTECLKYLETTVQLTTLKRSDDTITIMKQNNWNLINHSKQILSIQKDCQAAQRRDNLTFIPFQGPIGKVN